MSILALIKEKKPEELGFFIQTILNDFLKERIEETINELLEGEIEDFLTDALRDETFDIRNGFYKRRLKTSVGSIEARVPRDRLNLFETKLIQPYKQTCNDIEYIVQSLYLKGMSQVEISNYLNENLGLQMSRETIGKTVRKILHFALEFKKRKLPKCVIILMDATYVPIKRSYLRSHSTVTKECVEVIMGITEDGTKEILDFVTVSNESSNSWKEFLEDLKTRGIGEPKLFITDELQGMPEAIKESFPKAQHQRCMVHIQRNIMNAVRIKDKKEISSDFKNVYEQETKEKVKEKFNEFTKKWGITYPHLIAKVMGTENLFTYLNFPKAMWKYIRTTNAIESFNSQLQRCSDHRILYNSETNEIIVITNCIADYNQSCLNKKEKYYYELTEGERDELGFKLI